MGDSNTVFIIVGVIWSLTLLRSVLIMLAGKSIFKKAAKNEATAIYPIINLFTMLDVCDISTFFGILLFIPLLNLIVLFMMSYKLGEVFNTGLGFKLGLVCFPLMFYLLLAFSDKQYKMTDEAYFKAMDRIKDKDRNINLMTDEEIRRVAEKLPHDEKEDVDSIFKSNIQMMEQVEPYKAAKIDLLGLEKLKNHDEEDDPTLRDLGFTPKTVRKDLPPKDILVDNQPTNKGEIKEMIIDKEPVKKEVPKEAPKEVPKEVAKEAPKEPPKEEKKSEFEMIDL